MKKLLIIGFFCLFSALTRAEVQAQIEPSTLSLTEPFKLILTLNSLQSGGVPDLTPLQEHFLILGTERYMNYSIINGQTEYSNKWIITLKAQKEGKQIIPAIKIGKELTTPISIDIASSAKPKNKASHDTNPDRNNNQQGLYLTAEIDKKNPYLNQQITYKVTLYNAKQILDARYQGPQVENALIIPLGQEKQYQIDKNNTTYTVEEQNYAIFPQKSGPLKIKSPIFTALVYGFNPERIKAQDKTIDLNVKPIPKGYSGKELLPAKQVTLSEQYENSEKTMMQGNTLTRTVTLEGIGIPAQLLPKLHFDEANGFTVYPEKGQDQNQVAQGKLIGRTEFKITYLFNKAGKITIPELKLPWFNTETGKEEVATLPAKAIEITLASQTSAKNQDVNPVVQESNESSSSIKMNWGWIVAAFFALAWLLTLVLWSRQKYKKNTGKGEYKTALNELYQAACTKPNPQHARSALLKWASLHWPDAPILNLTDLIQLAHDSFFKKQVQVLSQVLYKNQEKALWRGDELWRSVQTIKKTKGENNKEKNALPPINPL